MKESKKLVESIGKDAIPAQISFEDFMSKTSEDPKKVLRNVFQLVYDMVHHYVPEGVNEYPDDPESIGYLDYDFSKIFSGNLHDPFFPDRLLSNRLIDLVNNFKRISPNNPILFFEGPPGSGKSLFINNFVSKFEEYRKTPQGEVFETIWKLDVKSLGGFYNQDDELYKNFKDEHVNIRCPYHDHPILQIPVKDRKDFLENLIPDEEFKEKLFGKSIDDEGLKEYSWVFNSKPCHVCSSLYEKLSEKLSTSEEIFQMINVRPYIPNRARGEGISIFNPSDFTNRKPNTNEFLQNFIDDLLRDSDATKFVFSNYARTNNGIYVLMDLKDKNKERFRDLHGISSDKVHKVGSLEEKISSLFVVLSNPSDTKDNLQSASFKDRIVFAKIPRVLDYNTELKIYNSKFSGNLEDSFFPGVAENFAKTIISTRLDEDSSTIDNWLEDYGKYSKILDQNKLLLKMDIYAGLIPSWLSEEDEKNFDYKTRKRIISESEKEGFSGFSGRDSIKIFNQFINKHENMKDSGELITMEEVYNFFKESDFNVNLDKKISGEFLSSLKSNYDFSVLNQIKESLYYYNDGRIANNIKNYLYLINFEPDGVARKIPYTGEEVVVEDSFFDNFEDIISGSHNTKNNRIFRNEMKKVWISKTLAQDMHVNNLPIEDTKQYHYLLDRYAYGMKRNVLVPFLENPDFRESIKDFGTNDFNKYDKKLKNDVEFLLKNMVGKFNYTSESAKDICLYALDNKIPQSFSVPELPDFDPEDLMYPQISF